MPRNYYIQPDAPDPVLSEETVLSLARQFVADVEAVTTVDESGGEARTYLIDDHWILKTQRPQQLRPRTSLRKEVVFLLQLQRVERVSVPRFIGYGHTEQMLEYTLMTRMPGVAVRNAKFEGEIRRETLKDLGHMLRRIHSTPQESLRESGLFFGDLAPVDIHWRMGSLPDVKTIVALHSNPGPEHTFVDSNTGRLTGIIASVTPTLAIQSMIYDAIARPLTVKPCWKATLQADL